MTKTKIQQRDRRRKRIRAKISGTSDMPRLSVFKSNKYLYAQLIDDENGKTLASASSMKSKSETKGKSKGGSKLEEAKKIGIELAKIAQDKKIKKAVFDRGGFIYTGRVKALAEGAREGGLKF